MTDRCERYAEMLSAFLDGEDHGTEAGAARAHLESCASCRTTLRDWQALDAALAPEIAGPVVTEAQARARAAGAAHPRRWRSGIASIAAAMLVLAGTGAVVAALNDGGDRSFERAGSVLDEVVPLPIEILPSREPSPTPTERPTERPTARPSPSESPEPRPSPTRTAEEMPTATRGSNGELVLMLRIESAQVPAGEAVAAGAVLRNATDRPITFRSPANSAIDLVIRDREGNEVYRRSHAEGWERELVTRTLEPGEQIAERFRFVAPRPGGYLIVAQCVCFPEDREPSTTLDPRSSSRTYPFETAPLRFISGRQA